MAKIDAGSVRFHRGGWEVRVQRDGTRVTRRVKAPNTRAGRQAAEAEADRLARQLDAGTLGATVADALDMHELAHASDWSPSTRRGWPGHRKALVDALGTMRLDQLRRIDIEGVYRHWTATGSAPATVRRRHTVLLAALNSAERWEMIGSNPARSAWLPAATKAPPKDLPAMGDVFDAIEKITDPHLRMLAVLATATGARRGELCALRWRDVDLEVPTVTVAAALSVDETGKVHRVTTKGKSATKIAIDPETASELKTWRTELQKRAMAQGRKLGAAAPLIPAPGTWNEVWHPSLVSVQWGRARTAAGLDGVKLHDLRHLHATTILADGVPVPVVAARLGHASSKMTLDVYGHAIPAQDGAAADAITKARTRSKPKPRRKKAS
jgi:integrase